MPDWWNPFDDPGGAFQGGGGAGGVGEVRAERGDPRGTNVNRENFNLNYDPTGQLTAMNAASVAAGQSGQIGAQAQGLGVQGDIGRAQAGFAANRTTPQFNAAGANMQAGTAFGRGQQQGDIANQIAARAGQTTGSGAQAQLQQGINAAMDAQLAIAGAGSGLGGNAAALAQASGQAPSLIAQQANESARLQAETDQADAARQLQALGMSGDLTGQARAQDLGLMGAMNDTERARVETALQGMSMNDALQLGLGGQALDYSRLGIEGQMGAADLGLSGGQLGLGAGQLGLQAQQSALEGRMAYEQMLTDLYGIDSGAQQQARANDITASQNMMGNIAGLGTAIGGLAMMSDEDTKKKKTMSSLNERYSAIGGY